MALDAMNLKKAEGNLSTNDVSVDVDSSSRERSAENIAIDPEKANGELYESSDSRIGTRRMQRVEAPLLRRNAPSSSDSGSDFSVSKQLESEADHTIKYRSCSWHKVRRHLSRCPMGS